MAKQTINIGSSVNKGDGDPLRTAFDKINDNFDELYTADTSNFDGAFSSLTGKPTTIAGYGITDGHRPAGVVLVPADTGFSTDSINPTILDNTTNSTYIIKGTPSVNIYADIGSGAYVGQIIRFVDAWNGGLAGATKISGNIFEAGGVQAASQREVGIAQSAEFVWDGTAWYYWT